jgi:hypothetical protein
MRSHDQYIITQDEVHGYANFWLSTALRLEYEGTKCTASTLLQLLLLAAARTVSIFAACRDLADAPCDQTIRNALAAALPPIDELQRRLNRSLCTKLPKALFRKPRRIAIDLTLIPYHGKPLRDEKEIYRSEPKSGTTHFHAYATAAVVHKGHRYTLALVRVEYGVKMKDVVQQLLAIIRSRGVKVRFLLLDKGFFSVEVITYLKRTGVGFIIPVIIRGRKPKGRKKTTGLRAIRKNRNGYYQHTLTGKINGKQRKTHVTICVASKSYTHKKSGKRRSKKLLYVVWKVRLTPKEIREMYRKRFGIETSYRQMHEARIRTCTRDPRLRLLFVAIALVLRNIWVWLHFQLAKGKWSEEPQLFLKLLRFRQMLQWINQVVGQHFGAGKKQGIEYEVYQRLTENY